jgi:hypothetical protein
MPAMSTRFYKMGKSFGKSGILALAPRSLPFSHAKSFQFSAIWEKASVRLAGAAPSGKVAGKACSVVQYFCRGAGFFPKKFVF